MSKEHLERVRRSFATQADWYAGPVLPLTTEALNDWIRDSLPRGGVEVALDVAAGTGVLSRIVAPFAEQVVALDATPEMIRKGRQMTEREGIANIRFEEGLAEAVPYPDGSFDLVVSRLGFHHFQNANEAMDEIVRVCKASRGNRCRRYDIGPRSEDRRCPDWSRAIKGPLSHALPYRKRASGVVSHKGYVGRQDINERADEKPWRSGSRRLKHRPSRVER